MKFRKKPVVIDAWPVSEILKNSATNWSELPEPVIEGYKKGLFLFTSEVLFIKTLEGDLKAGLNDMLLMGVKGEFYPCKPDIFEATYERVEE